MALQARATRPQSEGTQRHRAKDKLGFGTPFCRSLHVAIAASPARLLLAVASHTPREQEHYSKIFLPSCCQLVCNASTTCCVINEMRAHLGSNADSPLSTILLKCSTMRA